MTTTIACSDCHALPGLVGPRTTELLAEQVAACIRRHLDGDREAMADLTRQVTPWLSPHRPELPVAPGYGRRRRAVDTAGRAAARPRAARSGVRPVLALGRRPTGGAPRDPDLNGGTSPSTTGVPCTPSRIRRRARGDRARRGRPGSGPAERREAAPPAPGSARKVIAADRPSYAAISAALGMPVGSIGPTRRRGLERMRRLSGRRPGVGHGDPRLSVGSFMRLGQMPRLPAERFPPTIDSVLGVD